MMEPLYLVPGWLCDRTIWRRIHNSLSRIAELHYPANRDFDTVSAMASAIIEEAPPRFSIAGHSLGGRVALEVYRQAPERVNRIALLNTATGPAGSNEERARQPLLDRAINEGMDVIARQVLIPSMLPEHRGDRQLVGLINEMVRGMSAEQIKRQFRAMLTRPDATPLLATIRVPVMMIFGRDDHYLPVDRHGGMVTRAPFARMAVIEECGHLSPLEQPESIVATLAEWLTLQ